ncbi:hypothetical protein U2F26_33385 [Micromonospora sp. 4G57]|uniref:Uncharacterized protein n=1 Tax=Micromonospora sicca TaxID=2202420 RepID=A0ABU5JPP9_9ACTN|nr:MULTISPECIES: hypothetical protein [unclassified Micromonospora]MDZ5447545.1 hypothetical protein [Micromonospora sp. 4G57]MDZ5494299.1 hypothetical protein [Micromonospora sp. 4G53]
MTDDGAAGRAGKNTVEGNRSFGSAHRSTIIHGDNNIIYPPADSDDDDERTAEEEPASASHPFPWKWIAGAIVAIILCNIIPDPPEPKSSFPAENGTRPV